MSIFRLQNLIFLKKNDNFNSTVIGTSINDYFIKLPEYYSGTLYTGVSKFNDLPEGANANSFFYFNKTSKSGWILIFSNMLHNRFIGTKFNDGDAIKWSML